jgi:Holliday junction resolvase-like predicted endonuclease
LATKYSKGRAIEQRVMTFLKMSGFSAMRSAGSKGVFDIIAYNKEMVRFIQIKSGASPRKSMYKADIESIMSTEVPPVLSSRELWIHKDNVGFTEIYINTTLFLPAILFPAGVEFGIMHGI